jgi:TIR domain
MKAVPIFISFSQRDRRAKAALLENLDALRTAASDFEVLIYESERFGEWKARIGGYIRRANISVLLLSDEFLKSEPCAWEVSEILQRKSAMRIIPILLDDCGYETRFPSLEPFHVALFKKPIRRIRDRKSAWRSIAASIVGEVQDIQSKSPAQRMREENQVKLWRAVEKGLFTPILGSSCHSIAQEREEVRPYLEERLRWLMKHLRGSAEEDYVKSVVQANLPGLLFPPLEAKDCKADRRGLVAFQALLTRAGVKAARLFSEAMNWNTQSFTDIYSVDVNLVPFQTKRYELRKLLIEATEKASLLEDQKSGDDSGLGIRGIKRHLVWLTWAIFSEDFLNQRTSDPEVERWIDRYPLADLWFGSPPIGAPKISLAHLEWMADLLWHTLRFDAPIYPASKDLALQIALCASQTAPLQRTAFGTTALMTEEEERTKLVQRLWSIYSSRDSKNGPPSPLYKTLVRAVCHEPSSPRRRLGLEAPARLGGSLRFLMEERHLRLIVNTNLDPEIERAFVEAERGFGVLLPVWVEFERWGERHRRADWLLVYQEKGERETSWMLWGDDLEQSILQRTRDAVRGPLIVKLYGSPLQALPVSPQGVPLETAEYLRDALVTRFLHRLVLSDLDLLEYSIPQGLRSLLAERGRTLCFMGFAGSDFVSRRQLYELVPGEGSAKVLVIGSPKDPAQSVFFRRMNIDLVQLDTDQISEVISEMPSLAETGDGIEVATGPIF